MEKAYHYLELVTKGRALSGPERGNPMIKSSKRGGIPLIFISDTP